MHWLEEELSVEVAGVVAGRPTADVEFGEEEVDGDDVEAHMHDAYTWVVVAHNAAMMVVVAAVAVGWEVAAAVQDQDPHLNDARPVVPHHLDHHNAQRHP